VRLARVALLLLAACLGARGAGAHELRPGYLALRETGPADYDVLWKVPARGALRLGLSVTLPGDCTSSAPRGGFVRGAYLERWSARCERSLAGRSVRIEGLAATRTDVLARVERLDGSAQTARVSADTGAFEVAAAPSRSEVALTYLRLGVEHILLGVDHLLFVLALLFLVRSGRRLVATVTAFTAAHSLTLAAATLGWVRVPQTPVEAAIALSIVFVAAELARAWSGADLAGRAPWVVAFLFGLLHGLGFAGALREVGLPQQAIPMALIFFNVGVELGQLAFVAAVLAALSLLDAALPGPRAGPWRVADRVRAPVAYAIGALATFWLIERTAAFWA
jgi:hydrogenase/urease accessory protein HupE